MQNCNNNTLPQMEAGYPALHERHRSSFASLSGAFFVRMVN